MKNFKIIVNVLFNLFILLSLPMTSIAVLHTKSSEEQPNFKYQHELADSTQQNLMESQTIISNNFKFELQGCDTLFNHDNSSRRFSLVCSVSVTNKGKVPKVLYFPQVLDGNGIGLNSFFINEDGYSYVFQPTNPDANSNKYVFEPDVPQTIEFPLDGFGQINLMLTKKISLLHIGVMIIEPSGKRKFSVDFFNKNKIPSRGEIKQQVNYEGIKFYLSGCERDTFPNYGIYKNVLCTVIVENVRNYPIYLIVNGEALDIQNNLYKYSRTGFTSGFLYFDGVDRRVDVGNLLLYPKIPARIAIQLTEILPEVTTFKSLNVSYRTENLENKTLSDWKKISFKAKNIPIDSEGTCPSCNRDQGQTYQENSTFNLK